MATKYVFNPFTGKLDAVTTGVVSTEDFLLANEPNDVGTTYTITRVSGKVTQEKWVRTADSTNYRVIDYTYIGSKVTTEVRRVYAANGITVIAQMTITYSYTGSNVTGAIATRDV